MSRRAFRDGVGVCHVLRGDPFDRSDDHGESRRRYTVTSACGRLFASSPSCVSESLIADCMTCLVRS